MFKDGERIRGEISSLAFGGMGVMKNHAKVVFVPFSAPGDVLDCTISEVRSNFARATINEVEVPSPVRILPRCPYYGICGGCQLQHIHYDAQLEYKRNAVFDSLKRIGKISIAEAPEIVPAQAIWDYRRHITLSLDTSKKDNALGFVAIDNESLVFIEQCPIFNSSSPIFLQLQQFILGFGTSNAYNGKITIYKTDEEGNFVLHLNVHPLPSSIKELCEKACQQWKNWQGVVVGIRNPIFIGNPAIHFLVEDLQIEFTPPVFIQNHAKQSLSIYKEIIRRAKELDITKILDLYCGIGISSLMLAKENFQVWGLEGNPQAIQVAKQNGVNNQIKNAHFYCGEVGKKLPQMLKQQRPDLVILNPPRTGISQEVVKALLESRVKSILYISCMPPTLARDLNLLINGGYKFHDCRLFDMFPQTSHVESLVQLNLSI